MTKLNIYYYLMMVLALLAAVGSYYMVMHNVITPIDPQSALGQAIQYVIIFDALITIPGGLYMMKHVCKRLSQVQDTEQQLTEYDRYAALRIVLVSNAMVLGIVAFYLLGAYQSMIWVAAISAIGWYFTKPTARKRELELTPEDPNAEKY